jgi:uncharacterized protein YlzI (FlbEa/FlbD family)
MVSGNNSDIVIKDRWELFFIDSHENQVNQGKYLFKVNNNHQFGELQLYPDGNIYLLNNGERFLVDKSVTEIVGKVVSVLKQSSISLTKIRSQ